VRGGGGAFRGGRLGAARTLGVLLDDEVLVVVVLVREVARGGGRGGAARPLRRGGRRARGRRGQVEAVAAVGLVGIHHGGGGAPESGHAGSRRGRGQARAEGIDASGELELQARSERGPGRGAARSRRIATNACSASSARGAGADKRAVGRAAHEGSKAGRRGLWRRRARRAAGATSGSREHGASRCIVRAPALGPRERNPPPPITAGRGSSLGHEAACSPGSELEEGSSRTACAIWGSWVLPDSHELGRRGAARVSCSRRAAARSGASGIRPPPGGLIPAAGSLK
jgi:hypothetical protein